MRFFQLFINTIFWLWAFVTPVIACGLLGLWIYSKSERNLPYLIILLVAGTILGVIVAEKIRKKFGLSHFFSRAMASPDLDPREEDVAK